MNYNSKIYISGIIISVVVGWFLTGSLFAIFLISLLWHFLFRNSDQIISDDIQINSEQIPDYQINPLKCVACIAVSMLNIRGNIVKDDIEKITNYFISSKGFGKAEINNLKVLIFEVINGYDNLDTEKNTQIINRYYKYEEKLSIIELLFSLIYDNSTYGKKQLDYVFKIAQYLEIIHSDYTKIKATFTEKDSGQYYDILNLSTDATLEEIKLKYRKMAMQLHPDQNKNSDNSEDFQKLVHAYKEILKHKENK